MACGGCSNKSTKIVQKTSRIVEGWTNLLTNRHKNTPFVKSRAQICAKCKHLNNTTKFCKLCRCFIPAKITVKKEKCPFGYWGKIT